GMSELGDSLDRDLHLRAGETANGRREADVVGRVLELAAARGSDERAWALVRLAADFRALGRHDEVLRVLDAAWYLEPSEQPELAIFSCAIGIHCDRRAYDVAMTLERDFADRGIDLKFARACVRLYVDLYAETEDEEHQARVASYRSYVELFEAEASNSPVAA
ncbi:MAG: hypothetical protein ACRDQT_12085, partial [Gaiellaceae bacterium]